MVPRKYRLKHMKDFEILFKEGRFISGEYITAKVWTVDPIKYKRRKYARDELRIAFVVGLKVSKSAVKRNKIKRQIREITRLHIKEDKIKKGFLVALIAKRLYWKKHIRILKKILIECYVAQEF